MERETFIIFRARRKRARAAALERDSTSISKISWEMAEIGAAGGMDGVTSSLTCW